MSSGWMAVDLDHTSIDDDSGKHFVDTTFEAVEKAITNGSVLIPDTLHASEPEAVQFDVHIRGCRIGQSRLFVEKLKEAFDSPFGSPRSVTAPKHFHAAGVYGTPLHGGKFKLWGSYEYLGYSFQLFRRHVTGKTTRELKALPSDERQFLTQDEAVDAFHNAVDEFGEKKFRYIEHGDTNREIPRDKWLDWIPKDIQTIANRKFTNWTELGQDLGGSTTRLDVKREFRHELDPYNYFIKAETDPGDQDAMFEKFEDLIRNKDNFQSDHAFPVFKRYGYDDIEGFINGYNWWCQWLPKKKLVKCTGTRDLYTVIVPILHRRTENLFFNFFPAHKSPLKKIPDPFTDLDGEFFDDLFLQVF
jgi:hypothetical protein